MSHQVRGVARDDTIMSHKVHPSWLTFTNSKLEEEYVGHLWSTHREALDRTLRSYSLMMGLLLLFNTVSIILSPSGDQTRVDFSTDLVNFVSFLLVWMGYKNGVLKLEGKSGELRLAILVTFGFSVIVYGHSSSLYSMKADCLSGEGERDDFCSEAWSSFLLLCGVYMSMGLQLPIYLDILGLQSYAMLAFTIVVVHCVRTIVLTPVPSALLPVWIMLLYGVCPVYYWNVARSVERSKRLRFLLEKRLNEENVNLQEKLGEAERALAFEKPTEAEAHAVQAVLGNETELGHCEVEFEQLQFQERIGAGAFGEVIKAQFAGSTVAVKRLLRSRIDAENVLLFKQEVLRLRQLHHPNIVQYLGASWDNVANICIVFEYVERGSLKDALEDATLALSWADPKLKMAIDVGCGLSYLHSRSSPLIHRDVKPDNILVTRTFACKVSDFGASREACDWTMTQTGTSVYMAPEIMSGEYYSPKVDVFSFGIMLVQMHSRKPPYEFLVSDAPAGRDKVFKYTAVTQQGLQARVLRGLRPTPAADMPPALVELAAACWREGPESRPTFAVVLQLLRTYQSNVNAEDHS